MEPQLQTEVKRMAAWHHMTNQPDITIKNRMNLVKEEIGELQTAETFYNLVKEHLDVMYVAYAVFMFHPDNGIARAHLGIYNGMIDALKYSSIPVAKALKVVNDSNYSKFILPSEIDEAAAHFENLGIAIRIEPLNDDCSLYGVYSAKDQEVGPKTYAENKLLKGHKYAPVDESKEWWL